MEDYRHSLCQKPTNQPICQARYYGNVVHEILSLVKYQKDIEKAVEIALANGWIHFEQTETVTQTIQAIVSHPELMGYFEEGNQVFNEQAIIQNEGKTIKPDRMVLKGANEMLLLDYKTGVHNVKYQQQTLMTISSLILKMATGHCL